MKNVRVFCILAFINFFCSYYCRRSLWMGCNAFAFDGYTAGRQGKKKKKTNHSMLGRAGQKLKQGLGEATNVAQMRRP